MHAWINLIFLAAIFFQLWDSTSGLLKTMSQTQKEKKNGGDEGSAPKRPRLNDSSVDEYDGLDDDQILDAFSNYSDVLGENLQSQVQEDDESDDDIINVYCSGKVVHLPNNPNNQNNTDDPILNPVQQREDNESQLGMLSTEPSLCPEQVELVKLIIEGRNVFYTGSAGCGKSTVLKAFTSRLRALGKTVHIIAPTGRAALEVGGSTTWTYAGWRPASQKKSLEELKQETRYNKHLRRRLKHTDVLVIDEVSMVENFHFERLSEVMKAVRDPDKVFGGVQLVVTGDFHQLPPVKPFEYCLNCGNELVKDTAKDMYTCKKHGSFYDEDKWAFQSKAWNDCDFVYFSLNTIHRQRTDKKFLDILQTVRLGDNLTESQIELLKDHKCATGGATRLYATREEVRKVNQREFDRLNAESYTYKCLDVFDWNEAKHPHLKYKGERSEDGCLPALDEHRFERCLELKLGALVVLLVNLDLNHKLCNGSQGIICGYEPFDLARIPRARHKKKEEDSSNTIYGEHAYMKEAQIRKFIDGAEKKFWPVVKFHNGETRTIYAECWIHCLGNEEPYSILSRTQIPLAPAWAMSIHKSQSLTLDRVIVDLSRAWEEGQVYVALSRATSLEGLKIEGDPKGLATGKGGNSEVRKFYREHFGM